MSWKRDLVTLPVRVVYRVVKLVLSLNIPLKFGFLSDELSDCIGLTERYHQFNGSSEKLERGFTIFYHQFNGSSEKLEREFTIFLS